VKPCRRSRSSCCANARSTTAASWPPCRREAAAASRWQELRNGHLLTGAWPGQELSLHSLDLEEVALLGHACRQLQILYLQNNVLGRLGASSLDSFCRAPLSRSRRCRALPQAQGAAVPEPGAEQPAAGARRASGWLQRLTAACGQVENLAGCESLAKLDLSANFLAAPAGLLSVAALAANSQLTELFLTGNPCTAHPACRPFVVASLPQLRRLDGTDVTPSERIRALQARGNACESVMTASHLPAAGAAQASSGAGGGAGGGAGAAGLGPASV